MALASARVSWAWSQDADPLLQAARFRSWSDDCASATTCPKLKQSITNQKNLRILPPMIAVSHHLDTKTPERPHSAKRLETPESPRTPPTGSKKEWSSLRNKQTRLHVFRALA